MMLAVALPQLFVRLEPSFSEDRVTISVWEAKNAGEMESYELADMIRLMSENHRFEIHSFPHIFFTGGYVVAVMV